MYPLAILFMLQQITFGSQLFFTFRTSIDTRIYLGTIRGYLGTIRGYLRTIRGYLRTIRGYLRTIRGYLRTIRVSGRSGFYFSQFFFQYLITRRLAMLVSA
jgi:hypothetical protein